MTSNVIAIVPAEKPSLRFATHPANSSTPLCSEARLSKVQPTYVGHPYKVFTTLEATKAIPQLDLLALRKAGVQFEQKTPLFLKTDQAFVCITMRYGDSKAAELAVSLLSRHTRRIYKNWK